MKIANGLEFINDEDVIGKWENIGWTENSATVSINDLNDVSGEFHILFFLPNGEPYWIFEGWTKGVLLIHYGGDDPILSYNYEISLISGKHYLFLHLENKTEVFIKRDNIRYNKETLGRHDDINKPFISDNNVFGKWRSVAFVGKAEDFNEDDICQNLYLKFLEFFPDGSLIQSYMDTTWQDKWTKGYIMSIHRTTAAEYYIEKINGTEYLFMEWKKGNYIYGGMKPDYYVFKREK
ncbi:hypothetical protein [Ruminococcus albus]|uniref:hypothetical protein n=1 Tax=Ruminococcus albus TaxID=1264 RepID=UPI000944EE43|nr:hypothetical protein [Ruminococcus albus]